MHALHAPQITLKFYLQNEGDLDFEAIISMFHQWISDKTLEEIVIDVADYRHLPKGPQLLLAALDANYVLDDTDGELGLLYQRKRGGPKDFDERIKDALYRTLTACSLMEKEASLPKPLRFSTDRFVLGINNRLMAPNETETFAVVDPNLRTTCEKIYAGCGLTLTHLNDPRALFQVLVEVFGDEMPNIDQLLERIGLASPG